MVSFIKKILVPLDGSSKSLKAFDQAVNLAKLTDAKVTALNVIPHVGEGGTVTKEFDKQTVLQGKSVVHNADKIANEILEDDGKSIEQTGIDSNFGWWLK